MGIGYGRFDMPGNTRRYLHQCKPLASFETNNVKGDAHNESREIAI